MRLRKLTDNASIGTYVLILFGMTFMLYLFGFTNTWVQYIDESTMESNGTGVNLSNGSMMQKDSSNPMMMILRGLFNFITENAFAFGASLVGMVMLFVGARFLKIDISAIYTYIIPIAILTVFLNIIVFPITSIAENLQDMAFWGISVSVFLIAFFNLIYILAIIEFVRSGTTT